ncbi:MAG: hypothetical protein HC883_00135 [Bdellovibrionaceae bacterium]|nr:hypothetical protein [Pseudobdellovibrionaceae bacterium]
MAHLLTALTFREFDSNGAPLVGGKLYSYLAGTSTPLATYSDPAGETPNTNPVVLDGDGRADVYLGNGSYKFILTDAADVPIYEKDDIQPSAGVDVESASPGPNTPSPTGRWRRI